MPLTPRRDDPESRRFWEFVEQTAREVREERPSWAQRDDVDQRPNADSNRRCAEPSGRHPRERART